MSSPTFTFENRNVKGKRTGNGGRDSPEVEVPGAYEGMQIMDQVHIMLILV